MKHCGNVIDQEGNMNWAKLNIKEAIYYCKSFEVGFDCGSFSLPFDTSISMR